MTEMRRLLSLALAMGLPGCGPASPSAPTRVAPDTPAGLAATVIPEVGGRTVVELSWSGASTATGYTLEFGTRGGTYDLGRVEFAGPATSYHWTGVPVGNLYVRLRARNEGGETPSAELLVGSVDPEDVIDALILGSGRLAVARSPGCPTGAMIGWRPDSGIAVRPSPRLSETQRRAVERTSQQVAPATRGLVRAGVSPTDDPDPQPAGGEVTLTRLPLEAVRALCRSSTAVGCAQQRITSGRFIESVRIVATDAEEGAFGDSIMAHELGHAIGMCHIIYAAGFTPPPTMGVTPDGLYSPGRGQLGMWEPATVKALETVYGAGLSAGATRNLFVAAGLVPAEPSGVTAASLARAGFRWPKEWRVEELPGGDLIVTKPFCAGSAATPNGT
jgi:hypothetical protein